MRLEFNDKKLKKCLWCEELHSNFRFCSKECKKKYEKASSPMFKYLNHGDKRYDANGDLI